MLARCRQRTFAALLLSVPWIGCGVDGVGECRGASCEPAACVTDPGRWRCLVGGRGQNTGWKTRRRLQTCGSPWGLEQQMNHTHDFYEQDLVLCPMSGTDLGQAPADGRVHGE